VNLSIIIPLFNEEVTITKVLDELGNLTLPEIVSQKEIIVVDDCSSDNSFQVVKDYIEGKQEYFLLHHEHNKGKGAAIHTALEIASGDTFVIQDADLELDPHDIPSLINAMTKLGVEFVNGSRFMPGLNRPLHAYRRYFGNKMFSALVSLLINVRVTDVACCYKLFKRSLLEKITLKEQRFGFEAEIMIKAIRVKRNNVTEVPVNYFPRNAAEGKKIRLSDGFRVLFTILKYGFFSRKG